MNLPNHEVIYERLRKGRLLDDLGLPRVDGRTYIDGLKVPEPQPTGKRLTLAGLTFGFFEGVPILKKVNWESLHFANCNLCDLGLFSSAIRNCKFEQCTCMHMGFWESHVSDSSFEGCDMRNVAFGGNDVFRPKARNEFRSVTFEQCDLRESAHSSELFRGCVFKQCRYGTIDFLGAVFEDCRFEGNLDEATFRNRDPNLPDMPENRLHRTDFREAIFTDAQFLNIDIDPAWFPSNDDVIILCHGPADWKRWLREGHIEPTEGMVWFVENMASHAGTPAIVTRSGLSDTFSAEQIEALVAIAEGREPEP